MNNTNSPRLHPILQHMKLSPEQELPVLSRRRDVVVSAGAGTGKTRTLVARFLGLLADGEPLGSIIAITFTVKAAREMRSRIRTEIRRYLATCAEENERIKWLALYDKLDAARISTIHSLAAEILRHHPAEMGLDPRFELLEEGHTAWMRSQAVEASLSWAAEDPEAALLFTRLGSWNLSRLIRGLLDNRLDVGKSLDMMPVVPWPIWRRALLKTISEFIENPGVQEGLDTLLALENEGIIDRAEAAGDQLVDDLRIVTQKWREIKISAREEDWVQISRSLGTLGTHLKQKGRAANWAPVKPKEIIKELQEAYQSSIGDRYDLDLETDRQIAEEIIPQLARVFRFAEKWYEEARQQLNGLDFDDLEQGALKLFQENPEVVRYWQDQVGYLLVDEYQDTNERQRSLINFLGGGRGELFIVGDGKQSIYRFRGADVSVFRAEEGRISLTGLACQLSTSYRAHKDLLNDLNKMLEPVLGTGSGVPYRVPFSPLDAGREKPPLFGTGPYLELHLVAGKKSDGAGLLAAKAVAARLSELVKHREGTNADSGLSYGDVAVLCRASSSFSDFETAFEMAGIPYLTIAGQGFYDRPEIRDLLNGMRFIAEPQNDLAAAGMLRSPIVGLRDDQLYLLRSYQLSNGLSSLYRAACRYTEKEENELAQQLSDFKALIRRFVDLSGRITAGELLARFVDQTGFTAALILAGQFRGAQNVKKLIREAQNSGIVEITDFLDTVDDIRSVAVREGEAPSIAEGSVQIMTVHQAKGLEFPIVVLGDASKRDPAIRNVILDERLGLLLPYSKRKLIEDQEGNPNIEEFSSLAYDLGLRSEKKKEEAESDRLLYVAATRSQELLIISGAVGAPTRGKRLPGFGGWLDKLADPLGLTDIDLALEQEGSGIHQVSLGQAGLQAELVVYEAGAQVDLLRDVREGESKESALPSETGFTEPISWSHEQAAINLSDQPISRKVYRADSAYMPSVMVGELVHRALEGWIFPAAGEDDFLRWVEAEFRNAGFYSAKAIRDGYQKTRKILERFQESDLFQRMDSAQNLKREVRFSVTGKEGLIRSGSIDALFKESGRWKLVEFKTDEIKSDGDYIQLMEEEDYGDQVAGYLEAAERILGERPDPILCFLNYQGDIYLETSLWQVD